MTTGEFANLVYQMRCAQKDYFRTRTAGDLVKSRSYEQRVDDILDVRRKRLMVDGKPVFSMLQK